MRTPFHAELDELITNLTTKIRLCAALMTNASTGYTNVTFRSLNRSSLTATS